MAGHVHALARVAEVARVSRLHKVEIRKAMTKTTTTTNKQNSEKEISNLAWVLRVSDVQQAVARDQFDVLVGRACKTTAIYNE